MKHVLRLLWLVYLLPAVAFAGLEDHYIGAGPSGMANAWVARGGIWSLNHNQAGLGFSDHLEAGVHYESRFLMKELSVQSAAFMLPTNSGTFGISYSGYGFSAYRETCVKLGYGLKLSEKLAAGIGIGYGLVRIPGAYGSRGVLIAEAGLQYKVNKRFTLGAHFYNASRSQIAEYNSERVPQSLRLGGDYAFSEKVRVSVEAAKDFDHPLQVRGGVEYRPHEMFYLRSGVSSGPVALAFGLGAEFKGFRIDLASAFHRTLGFSPQVSVVYQGIKTKR
jgi:hypothetical protein